jgi:transcriptional regulator with XRE-family HTH domain
MEPAAYRHNERGEVVPSFVTVARICEHLGITPNDLLPSAPDRTDPEVWSTWEKSGC